MVAAAYGTTAYATISAIMDLAKADVPFAAAALATHGGYTLVMLATAAVLVVAAAALVATRRPPDEQPPAGRTARCPVSNGLP